MSTQLKIVGTITLESGEVIDLSVVHGIYKDRGSYGYWVRKLVNNTTIKDLYPTITARERGIVAVASELNQHVYFYYSVQSKDN